MEEQIKQEAKERVKEHLILVLIVDLEEATAQAKKHALKETQNEINLLDRLCDKMHHNSILTKELNHLKQVKTEIEKL